MRALILGISYLTFLSSCGLGLASAHCDVSGGKRCQERLSTLQAEAFKATCSAAQGTAGDGPCKTEGRVGGCFLGKQGDNSSVNDWYYPPSTKADAQSACTSDNGTFLEP